MPSGSTQKMYRGADIVAELRERIFSGQWKPNQKTDSELNLAKEFGVCRATINKSLKELEREGLLRSKQGVGRFVADTANTKTGTLGVVVFDIDLLTHPVQSQRLTGIKNVIAKTDYHLHIFGINSSARSFLMTDGDQRWADLLDPSRLEGVIVIPREADPAQVEYLASLLPVVWMDLPAVHGELAGVRLDYLGAGFSAGKHLLDLGHRTIALATLKTGDPAWLDRDSGIRLAIRGAGKEKTCTYKRYNAKSFCEAEGYRLGNEYLNDASRPTAVICSSDELAVGFYRAVCKAGLTVPKDVSLIGWNDTLTTDDIPIPLTSVHMHYEAAGVRCAEKLLELLRHPQTTDDVEEIPADLIVRESTAAPTG